VFLIGHPSYYPKFGFKPARQYGFDLKQFNVPDEVFMVCELLYGEINRMEGELLYPNSFFT
jgi:predicted N-acetyltransferase YhbS